MNPFPAGVPTRFDLLLFVVGAALLSGGLAWVLSPISLVPASVGSSLVAGLAMFDGLIRNPPTGG
jgi:hypothetical protein